MNYRDVIIGQLLLKRFSSVGCTRGRAVYRDGRISSGPGGFAIAGAQLDNSIMYTIHKYAFDTVLAGSFAQVVLCRVGVTA